MAAGQFPQIIITYLQAWHDRFYLLDEKYPFFQVVAADVKPENISKTLQALYQAKHQPSHLGKRNKIALFSPKTANNKEILTPSECARWLLTFQGYTGLSDKVIFGKDKYKASKAGCLISGALP